MCFLIFYHNPLPTENELKLILAHNRDEYFDRPSQSASFLQNNSEIICGKDLTRDGTWLGICKKTGCLVTVLNIPNSRLKCDLLENLEPTTTSRGLLCLNYLEDSYYSNHLSLFKNALKKYTNLRFTLLFFKDIIQYPQVYYYNNLCHKELLKLNPGIYAFGNSKFPEVSLNTETNSNPKSTACGAELPKWKKLAKAKEIFTKILNDYKTTNFTTEQLSSRLINELLHDKTKNFPDPLYELELGKDYGFGSEELYQKSSIFVEPFKLFLKSTKPKAPQNNRWYGTRCMSVILVDSDNQVTFTESCLDIPNNINNLPVVPDKWTTTKHCFKLG